MVFVPLCSTSDKREMLQVEMDAMFVGVGGIGGVGGGGCELPKLLQRVGEPDANVAEMKMGSFEGPAGGRPSWGAHQCQEEGADSRCCEDPSRVGPPEQPCGGTYRHFPGQTFEPTSEWEWTAPSTGEFLMKVVMNCDVPFYADPTRPDCQSTPDGVSCADPSVEQCASAVGLTIITVDRAVHLKHRYDVPLPPGATGEQQLLLASMFQANQAPAMSFPTKIIPLDCNNAEQSAGRPLCAEFRRQQLSSVGNGGGHYRRRQLQELGCPHSTFLQRQETMLLACGLLSLLSLGNAITIGQLPVRCPSLECAEELVQLLEDCRCLH